MVRRKLEIKKIQDKSKRQVTFTKRRQGLFRKANELCKRCDAQIAVITFSLAGNLYAWGHPRVDSILKRYMDYPAQETDGNRQENILKRYMDYPAQETDGNHQENKSTLDDKEDKDHKNKRDMGLALSLSLPAYEYEKDHRNKRGMGLALSLSLPIEEKDDRNEKSEECKADLDLMKNKKRGQGHATAKSNMMMASWDLAKFDGLKMDELEQLIVGIREMQKKVVDRANQMRSSA